MEPYITALQIRKVRHLEDIAIPLAADRRKHLILTGGNGSGKTSLLEALADHLRFAVSEDRDPDLYENGRDAVQTCEAVLHRWESGASVAFSSCADLRERYRSGSFVLAFYRDSRRLAVEMSRSIEKINLQPVYGMEDGPGKLLVKYLMCQRATQAFSRGSARAEAIAAWFDRFQGVLRDVLEDPTLTLEMDPETFQFSICRQDREPLDFNSLSAGQSALLAILADLILRMESHGSWDLEGIVLIDEVEAHLHLGMQKRVLPLLTVLFPNVQFIVSTNSPFVLSSVSNAAVYDLSHRTLAEHGLANLPYEGVVEGWFQVDRLAKTLQEKYDRYCALACQDVLSDADWAEIAALELYLDKIPDYLAWEHTAEYLRRKLELPHKAEEA